MGNNPFDKIVHLLKNKNVDFKILKHEPVYTSEQAAKVRDEPLKSGAKSLLLKTDEEFMLAVIPGSKRLDSYKLKKIVSVKRLRFASSEEVEQIMGCMIGACYPIGDIIGIKTVVDKSLLENEFISFNPGVHDQTIKIKSSDLKKVANIELVDILE